MDHFEANRDPYLISTDPTLIDLDVVHGFISHTYWANGISRERMERAVSNSLMFGVYLGEERQQIGGARIVTDHATFAYLADVFIVEEHQGKGLSKWLCEQLFEHPDLTHLRRWILATKDAHTLYEKYGFTPLAEPGRYMERMDHDAYRNG